MSNVIDMFATKSHRVIPTLEELVATCRDDISGEWERYAANNRLNDYFLSTVPLYSLMDANYLADLTAVSVVEGKVGLAVVVNAPGTSEASKLGWVAGFDVRGKRVETPVMVCEAYARCFNILLFLKLNREISLKHPI